MLKKLLFTSFLFLPSLAFAQRAGTIRSGDDLSLSSNTILNSPTSVESKTVNVTSETVQGTLSVTEPTEGKFLKIYGAPAAFGPKGVFVQGKTEEEFGTGGPLTIAASTTSTVSAYDGSSSGHARQTSIDLEPPTSGDGGSIIFNVNGVNILELSTFLNLTRGDFQNNGDFLCEGGDFTVSNGTMTVSGNGIFGGDITVANTLGSTLGSYSYQGTTITYAAPAIDTQNRIPVLYNGAVSWPLMADGGSLSSSQTWSGYNQYTSTRGVNVSYGLVAGSVTANDFSASTLVYADANHKLSSATLSGLTLVNGTLTATGGTGASLSSTQTFTGANTFTSTVTIASADATRTPLVVQGASGQTNPLTLWQNSAGGTLFRINANGTFQWGSVQEGQLTFDGTDAYMDALHDLVFRPNNAGSQALRLSPTTQAALLKTPSAAVKGLTVRGFASQSANLQEWQNDSSVVGSSVSADGGTITASTFTVRTALQFDGGGYVMKWSTKPWASGDITVPTTSTQPIPGFTVTLAANTTYFFQATILISNAGIAGYKFAMDVPSDAAYRADISGPGSSATAGRTGERIDTDITVNTNAFGTFGNGNHQNFLTGNVKMGATAGTVSLCVVPQSGSSTAVVKEGSYMFLEKRDP